MQKLEIDNSRWNSLKIVLDDNDINYTTSYNEKEVAREITIDIRDLDKTIILAHKYQTYVNYNKHVLIDYKKEIEHLKFIEDQNNLADIRKRTELLEIFNYSQQKEHRFERGIEDKKKPLSEWAKEQLKMAFKTKGLLLIPNDINKVANEIENALCQCIGDSKKQREASTIYEDKNVLITGCKDFDYGYSMLKYRVTCKHTKMFYSESEMIAKD